MSLFSAAAVSEGVAAPRSSRLNEDNFRLLYDRTALPLRSYLRRLLPDSSKADDLVQESYLRLLQAKLPGDMEPAHLKNYLFRIATNLARTELARRKPEPLPDHASSEDNLDLRADMAQSLDRLNSRQRELLWLAYVERFSHEDIAAVVGAKSPSIRPMLARARGRLSEILRGGGFAPQSKSGKPR